MRAYFVEQCLHFLFNFFFLLCIICFELLEVIINIGDVVCTAFPPSSIVSKTRNNPNENSHGFHTSISVAWSNHNRILRQTILCNTRDTLFPSWVSWRRFFPRNPYGSISPFLNWKLPTCGILPFRFYISVIPTFRTIPVEKILMDFNQTVGDRLLIPLFIVLNINQFLALKTLSTYRYSVDVNFSYLGNFLLLSKM